MAAPRSKSLTFTLWVINAARLELLSLPQIELISPSAKSCESCEERKDRIFLNDLFYGPELYRRTGRDVKFFLMDEKPAVVPLRLGRRAVGRARKVP